MSDHIKTIGDNIAAVIAAARKVGFPDDAILKRVDDIFQELTGIIPPDEMPVFEAVKAAALAHAGLVAEPQSPALEAFAV